jgi:tetratricopeptide (TPR) repeat protein
VLLLSAAWLGSAAWFASSALNRLRAAQLAAQQSPLKATNAVAACTEGRAAGAAARHLRSVLLPATPLLRRLGWIPRYGATLAGLPALTDVGAASATVGEAACDLFTPAFAALDAPASQRLGLAVRALADQPPDWARLQAALTQLATAWETVPAATLQAGPLAPYGPQLQRLTTLLPDLRTSLDVLAALWPATPVLLGLNGPTSLLVAAQNPFELRPTGGFIGSIGTVTILNGKPQQLDYRNSGSLNVPAPAGSEFPQPYADYLRASQWLLRDANWWPHWERSARTLETFWELNDGAPVAGVVAVDLYALQEILGGFETLDVPGYGLITDTASLESIYRFYEPQGSTTTTNKAFLGALFAACLGRIQTAAPAELPRLGAALSRSLAARHISVYLHDPVAQQAFATQGWDGALRTTTADYLHVVDADLAYSDVQAFIDQQLGLTVQLDADGSALTNTLTITYSNRYDDWQAEQTQHQVYGYCYNVQKRQQERVAGCYGTYVRVYLPPSAAPLALAGADSAIEPGFEEQHNVVGFYLLIYPGQTRTVSLRYRPQTAPAAGSYRLVVQKQAGTLARPLRLRVQPPAGPPLSVQSDLWHDAEFTVRASAAGLQLESPVPPLHPSNTPERLATQGQWATGWALWQAGDSAAALEQWKTSHTLNAALDQVVALRWQGELEAARRLLSALDASIDDGRAAFLAGQLAEAQGDLVAARAAYQRALQRSPGSQVARLALALIEHQRGDESAALAMLRTMDDPLQALHRIRFDGWYAQNYAGADQINRLILLLNPEDTVALDQRYVVMRGEAANPLTWQRIVTYTNDVLTTLPNDPKWLQRRSEAYGSLQQFELALADLQAVTALSPTNTLAWFQIGLIYRSQGNLAAAIAALETATRLDAEQTLAYYVVLGETYEIAGQPTAARKAYQAALRIDPAHEGSRTAMTRLGE